MESPNSESPTPDDVRAAIAPFGPRRQKIVAGLVGVMIQEPTKVRDREWISEQLVELTLLAGDFEAETPDEGVQAVQSYLQAHALELLSAATLLFQRVGLDLAPRAAEGFSFDDAMRCVLSYLPPSEPPADAPEPERDLGEQPLARLMADRDLSPKDLVAASPEQLTHKMVTRAAKGRRLTANTMNKVHRAWNLAASAENTRAELFDYEP